MLSLFKAKDYSIGSSVESAAFVSAIVNSTDMKISMQIIL
jgi:hypothetical protein